MKTWLTENYRNNSKYSFNVYDISEQQDLTDRIKHIIANEILKAFRNPEGLKCQYKSKPREDLRNYINNELFSPPSGGFDTATRIGDWGEIFIGLYLIKIKGNNIPFYKIRCKHRKDKSVQMLDLLTFDEVNHTINFNEVKTKSARLQNKTNSRNQVIPDSKFHIAIDAYKELSAEYSADAPQIYTFIARMLYDFEQFDLANEFDQFCKNNQCNKKGNIFLLFDSNHWKEEVLEYLDNHQIDIQNLSVFVVLVKNLRVLIEETYNLTVESAENIVYG